MAIVIHFSDGKVCMDNYDYNVAWYEDEYEDYYSDDEFIRCSRCGNIFNIDELRDNSYICLYCFKDLGKELEKKGYSYDEKLGEYYKRFWIDRLECN